MSQAIRRLVMVMTRILLPVTILAVAFAGYQFLVRTAPQLEVSDTAAAALRITVVKAKKVAVHRQWSGYGTALAVDSADVPARVTATVDRVSDDIVAGAQVHKTQLLVQLDDSDFRRQVEIAEQNLAEIDAQMALIDVQQRQLTARLELETEDVGLAKDELKRVEQLADRGAANPRDVDLAKRAVIAAQIVRIRTIEAVDALGPRRLELQAQRSAQRSALRLADQNLRRCRIVSPIDGVLQSVDVEIGESLTTGQRVARVVNLDRIEVPLRLPASVRVGLAVGDRVQLRATNQTGLTWPAQVSRIGPEDDASTRTVTAYVRVDSDPHASATAQAALGRLAPGMFVAGVVTSRRSEASWVVPRRSVRDGHVLIVEEGVVQRRPVRVDDVLETDLPEFGLPDDQWAVLDGSVSILHEGDLVVVNASTAIQVGQAVDPVVITAAAAAPITGVAP